MNSQIDNDALYDQYRDMQEETKYMLDEIKKDTEQFVETISKAFDSMSKAHENYRKVSKLHDGIKLILEKQ